MTFRPGGHGASVLAAFVTVTALAPTPPALAQPSAALGAPLVQSRVRVQWDAAHRRLVAAVDDEPEFRALGLTPPFLTTDALVVTYPRLNPLRMSATVSPKDGPVPPAGVLRHLRALLAFASVTVPRDAPPSGRPEAAPADACVTARRVAAALMSTTSHSTTVAGLAARWRQSIDEAFTAGRTGAEAVEAAVAQIDGFLARLDAWLAEVDRANASIASSAGGAAPACDPSLHAADDIVTLGNAQRLQLARLRAATILLRNALAREYGKPAESRWRGGEFLLDSNVRPVGPQDANVTVRVTHLDFDVDETSGGLTGLEEHSSLDPLVGRRYSRFAVEVSIASVFTSVVVPVYGTTTDASGATVVGAPRRPALSVAPAILAGFACRCGTGPLIAPMLQLGFATSGLTPGLLGGGGVRLFGLPHGEVELGAGVMLGWVRDLGRLRVGDRVGGTSDIEADLRFVPRTGYYLALEYKF